MRAAEEAQEKGDWDAAETACSSALRFGSHAKASAISGRARLRKGLLKEAQQDLNEALILDPSLPHVAEDLSEVKLRAFLYPLDGPTLCERGRERLEAGDFSGAIIDLGLAVRLGQPKAAALLERAKVDAFSSP